MVFYSKKGSFVAILIVFLFIIGIVTLLYKIYIIAFPLGLFIAYLLWTWFDTYYTITGDELFYRCALLKGSVSINTITEVVKNKKQFSGVKASLSLKGLIIKYNKWDDVFISPEDVDQFIIALKSVNENIVVTG